MFAMAGKKQAEVLNDPFSMLMSGVMSANQMAQPA